MKKMFLKLKSVEFMGTSEFPLQPTMQVVEELQNGAAWIRLSASPDHSVWLESFPRRDGYEIRFGHTGFWHAAKNVRNIVPQG